MKLRLSRVLAVLSLVLVAAGCGTDQPDGAATGPTLDSTATARPANLRSVPVGEGPVGLAVAGGRVWVVDAGGSTLNELAPDLSGVETSVADALVTPLRVTPLRGVLWVTSFGGRSLVGFDPGDGSVTAVVKVGDEPEGLVALDRSLWVVLQRDAQLVEVDPLAGKVVRRIDVGAKPRQVAEGFGHLWVSDFVGDDVYRVDPSTGEAVPASDVCTGPQAMVAAGDAVWVSCTGSDEVVALDPETLDVVHRVDGLDDPDGLTVDRSGRLLVALQPGPTVAVIDPDAGTVKTVVALGQSPTLHDQANIDLVVVGDSMVVSSFLTGSVLVAKVP